MKNIILICCVICACLTGCVHSISSGKLMSISIDMQKQQVHKCLGEPTVLRGSIKNKYDQVVEVWEYRVDKGKTGAQLGRELTLTLCTFGLGAPLLLKEGEISAYWLYFCDGKLVKWGQAGDWKKDTDILYEINFNATPNI